MTEDTPFQSSSTALRELARGALDVEDREIDRVAGLVDDPTVRDILVFARQAYNRRSGFEDPDFTETQFYRDRVERYATHSADRAVRRGNLSLSQYLVGAPEHKPDVSGLHTIRKLEIWLTESERAKLVYLAALMGRGKTDFSLTMLQIINHYYRRIRESTAVSEDVPVPRFAANFGVETPPGSPTVKTIKNFDDLLVWSSDTGSDDVLWFVFDEASSELTAQSGANAQDVAEVFAPFVKKMRKRGVNLIVIGHDKGDVHPAIRTLADYVGKSGTKSASFYAGVKRREPTGHLFDIVGIPPTDWTFDTDDIASWSWGSALDEVGDGQNPLSEEELKRLLAVRAYRFWDSIESLTQPDAADLVSDDVVSISPRMIRDARDGKYEDVLSDVSL